MRRGNNEGSVLKRKKCQLCNKICSSSSEKNLKTCKNCGGSLPREGTWMAQAIVGSDSEGKPKRRSFYSKTRSKVIEKMQEVLQQVRQGSYCEPSKITLGQWMECWLHGYKRHNIRQNTWEGYQTIINVHIKPSLGTILLHKLKAADLQKFYMYKLENGRAESGGPLSTRYIRYLHTVIRGALQQAVENNLITRNPAEATSPPKLKTKNMTVLTEVQLAQFMETARKDRLSAAFILDISTGLRRGELLGLTWDSVNLEAGTITVKKQLLVLKDGIVLDEETKSKSGKRNVPIPENVVKELKAHKTRQTQEKWAYEKMIREIAQMEEGDVKPEEVYNPHNLLFTREDGSFLDPRNFSKHFQALLKKAGLPRVRLHDLRHSHASLLLAKGVHPKVVQERLGHSSITMTLDLYSHLAPGLQEEASAKLNSLFENKKNLPLEVGEGK